ncbi:MAG: DUF5765 domain-containing protein [Rickettsiales bacterium]|nr:DUF5765 domain-containing protein [Rickettsiales bacterium]
MCWSSEASIVLSTIGVTGTLYAAYKKQPLVLWMSLGYFTLMEILQAFTYGVIDQCHDPSNQVATILGYLHIVFQPFFIHAVALHFIPQDTARRIAPLVFTLCFFCSIMMLLTLYPFSWAGLCPEHFPLCSDHLCSVSGNWHIAWNVPLNLELKGLRYYPWIGMVLPFLYGSWRFGTYHFLMGPLLAYSTTDNINEFPAVWCLLSIGFLLIIVETPVRRILYVEKTWLDRFFKKKDEATPSQN